jgi:hypothetical protein
MKARRRLFADSSLWTDNADYRRALNGNPIKVLTLKEMVTHIEKELTRITDGKKTRAPASTDIGRTLQLFMAAGFPSAIDHEFSFKRAPKARFSVTKSL